MIKKSHCLRCDLLRTLVLRRGAYPIFGELTDNVKVWACEQCDFPVEIPDVSSSRSRRPRNLLPVSFLLTAYIDDLSWATNRLFDRDENHLQFSVLFGLHALRNLEKKSGRVRLPQHPVISEVGIQLEVESQQKIKELSRRREGWSITDAVHFLIIIAYQKARYDFISLELPEEDYVIEQDQGNFKGRGG